MYYSYKQFVIFRAIFGVYLAYHFLELLPYAEELFTTRGMIKNHTDLPTYGMLPVPAIIDCNIDAFFKTLICVALLLACGFFQTISSLILFYGWCFCLGTNVFISNPGIAYVGWLLLACAVLPNKKENWNMPSMIYWTAWFLLMSGYTISGLHKLQSPSWIDGTALYHVLTSMISRYPKIMSDFPLWIFQFGTWASLCLEITALPLELFYHTRKYYWLAFVAMHISVMLVINFTDLTLGMLMIHLFVFDNRWIPLSLIPYDFGIRGCH